ncbi:hypothetical protein V4100_001018 [Pseudomonas aeruginosa]
MISICEIYQNNSTSVLEIPDFRRSWGKSDELFSNPSFPKKNIYNNPSNVEAYLQSIPVDTRMQLLVNHKCLFSIMYNQYEKAAYAVEQFEDKFGGIDEFFKGIPAQMAAYTIYTFSRSHCLNEPEILISQMNKNWKHVNDSKRDFNLEFPKENYQSYTETILKRFDAINNPTVEPEKPAKELNEFIRKRNV